jgi:uncharacterized protein (TIGR02270 family)
METSLQSFVAALYDEHLSEASFLYDQCRVVMGDPHLPWTAVADFQDRLEAHLDALVLGGDLALRLARQRATEGDAGDLFAAACVCCRAMNGQLLAELFRTLDLADPARSRALTDALKLDMPDEWADYCVNALERAETALVPILAVAAAYRRLSIGPILQRCLPAAAEPVLPSLLWSVGRAWEETSSSVLRELVHSEVAAVAVAAARAGLRGHDYQIYEENLASTRAGRGDAIAIGLAGGPRATAPLVNMLERADAANDAAMALGLLGDLSAVRPLMQLLTVEEFAGSAAEALVVITGAQIMEEAVLVDDMSEEEMFPNEVEAFRTTGSLPRRPDGEPFGTKVRRVTRDPARWQGWLTQNASRFRQGNRYRFGKLCTPRVLLDCLQSEGYPKSYRPWAADELLIRYGIDLPFESDMPVARQMRILNEAAATVDRATRQFESGQWYFAGQPVA